MRILAIETSCDETAIAIAEFFGPRRHPSVRVLSHIVSSQATLHAKFGGVVPNLARREHEKNLVPILIAALRESGIKNQGSRKEKVERSHDSKFLIVDSILQREPKLFIKFKKYIAPLPPPNIDAIAVTYGPGLAPALWVGVNFARALAYLWDKPLIPVNHMVGHLYSALLQPAPRISNFKIPKIQFPLLALLVSGGHTELVLARGHGKFKIIGETVDDAVGEAFDKVSRILGLKYPGGPEISRLAQKGDASKYPLPSPMINTKDYNFSFSGLKTAVLYLVRDLPPHEIRSHREDIAASFQAAAIEVLVKKTIRAAKEHRAKTVLLGGGVAANKKLRCDLDEMLKKELPEAESWMPEAALAGDNALMIAAAAYFSDKKSAWTKVHADANLRLS